MLVIHNFSLAGSALNRKHGLATFVHERLEWSLGDQSPKLSETEWLCEDIANSALCLFKIRSLLLITVLQMFLHFVP